MSILVNWLQAVSGQPEIDYTAANFRQLIDKLTVEGVADKAAGDLLVSPRAAGANLSVDVAAGGCFVDGDDTAQQGTYEGKNTAALNVGPFAAAPGSGGRIDLVAFRVFDPQAGGPAGTSGPVIVQGVAGGAPVAPALPASAVPLAEVRLNAGDLSVQAANITDRRVQAASPLGLGTHTADELADIDYPHAPLTGERWARNAAGQWVPTTELHLLYLANAELAAATRNAGDLLGVAGVDVVGSEPLHPVVMPFVAPQDGWFTGLTIGLLTALTAGTVTLTVRKNGADTALVGTMAPADGRSKAVRDQVGVIAFAAGDRVDVRMATAAAAPVAPGSLNYVQAGVWGAFAAF